MMIDNCLNNKSNFWLGYKGNIILYIGTRMENHSLTRRKFHMTEEQRRQQTRQVQRYIQNRVMPLLAPLQIELLKSKPRDIQDFCIQWLKQSVHNHLQSSTACELESDEEPEELFKEKMREKLRKQRKGSRPGIMGDSHKDGLYSFDKPVSTPVTEWPEQTTVNLIVNLKRCVFFEHLQTEELLKLAQRMRAEEYQAGEAVIREGESGNDLYIVQSGRLQCQRNGSHQILRYYTKGEVFGQLSLLYNHLRVATVTAVQPCRLFALARCDFAATLHKGMLQKLRECEQLIDKVDIFQNLNLYERSKLYESMQVKRVAAEKYIIREGETGSCFYLVAEGQLVAYKQQEAGNKLVYVYRRGDYFGEIALLRNLPRQASVKTITDCRLYFINVDSFSRVLGPLQAILKRNQERYARIAAQLSAGQE